jgi:hypothetical protein
VLRTSPGGSPTARNRRGLIGEGGCVDDIGLAPRRRVSFDSVFWGRLEACPTWLDLQQLFRRDLSRQSPPAGRNRWTCFSRSREQIGHARNQVAVGHVNPQPVAEIDQGLLLGIRHAVEHLQLIGRWAVDQVLAVRMPWAMERRLWEPRAHRSARSSADESRAALEAVVRLPLL